MSPPIYCPAELPHGDSVFLDDWPEGLFPHPEDVRAHGDILSAHSARVVRFKDLGLVVKYGPHLSESEGQALWLLSKYTKVPVPTVYGWHRDGGDLFLYRSFVEGRTLARAWLELNSDQQDDVVAQLRNITAEVRHLQPQPDNVYIGSLGRTAINDNVLYHQGPFNSCAELHDAFVKDGCTPALKEWAKECRQGLTDDWPIVFTHCDLTPSNILVEPTTGKIAAIIDWERSGFYPAYWEWVKLRWSGEVGVARTGFLQPYDEIWNPWYYWLLDSHGRI